MSNSRTGKSKKKRPVTNSVAVKKRKPEAKESAIKRSINVKEFDFTFLTLVIVMICVGLVMILSASSPRALRIAGDSFHFFKKQLLFVLAGFVVMIFVSQIDYKKYERYVGAFMLICLGLLVLVLVPKIGIVHNGSRRWLPGPGFEIQPSEFMKPVIAMFIAKKVQEKAYDPTKLPGMLKLFLWVGATIFLMMREAHLSGAIVILVIAVIVMLAAGLKIRYFAIAGAVIIPAGLLYILNDSVRSQRLLGYMNPFADMQGTGYQAAQGLYAIASGGLFGQGLGQSIQKTSYLPEPYNDFIFAVVCEELGLLGAILVIGLFVALICRGLVIALHAPDTFSALTVVGIMAHIAIQTLFNICVVTTLIPNTGITLPFLSYGGTAIIVLMLEMGIVLNISRYRVKNKS